VDARWLLAFQMDWTNWSDLFVSLPVTLMQGTSATINSWRDQYGFHAGVERHRSEITALQFCFAHANDAVPASTLAPLTAATMTNQISTGFAHQPGRSKWEVSYAFRPTQSDSVGTSSLLSANTATARRRWKRNR
jgi:long-subunit fatty acid transport protein